jgi:hypothetical protein
MKIIWGFLFKRKPKDVYSPANTYVLAAQQYAPIIMNTLIHLGTLNALFGNNGVSLESIL